jgi:hypothetical protein
VAIANSYHKPVFLLLAVVQIRFGWADLEQAEITGMVFRESVGFCLDLVVFVPERQFNLAEQS